MNPFEHTTYLLQKQFWKVFGGSYRIYDPTGSLVLFASLKAFKLKEDISVYGDESKSVELLRIKARNIIDFSATYDVFDSGSGEKIGALRRRGLKSMFKDEWVILDTADNEIGMIQEDRWILAILRRQVTNLIPQVFHGEMAGAKILRFSQHFNPFVQKMDLDFTPDTEGKLDRRLGLAAAILLVGIEGRQE